MLAGVGVPDLRGSQSKGTFYTQDRTVVAEENEQLIFLDSRARRLTTRVIGPRNTKASPAADTSCEVRVHVDKAARKLVIQTGGSPAKIEVPEKGWSDWVRFKFKFSMLQSVTGIARFYVRQLEPHLEFYVSAVNFDPAAPMFPVSAPADYAKELADKIGLFSTLGMAEDHNGLNNGRLDEAAYLQQCELVLSERERAMRFELDRFSEGLFFMLFDTPDRVQHMLWRFRDREHPGFEPDLSPELATRIEEHYRPLRCVAQCRAGEGGREHAADRALRSRLRNFPPRLRYQYLAMAKRTAGPQRQSQAGRGPGRRICRGRLVENLRLRRWPGRNLSEPQRARERRDSGRGKRSRTGAHARFRPAWLIFLTRKPSARRFAVCRAGKSYTRVRLWRIRRTCW